MNENEIAIFDDMLLETVTNDNLAKLTAPMVGITDSNGSHTHAWYANQVITGNVTASDLMLTGTSSVTLESLISRIEDMKQRIDEITESVKVDNEPDIQSNHANFITSMNNHMHGLDIAPPSHNKSATAVRQQIDHAKADAERTSIAVGTSWFNTNSERQELFIREHHNLANPYADENKYMFQKAALMAKADMVIANPPYSIKSSHSVFDYLTKCLEKDETVDNFERAMEIVN